MDEAIAREFEASQRARRNRKAAKAGKTPDETEEDETEEERMARLLQETETQGQYLRRGRQLVDRYRRERRLQVSLEDLDPMVFAGWMSELRPGLRKSAWRTYRQAGAAIILTIPHDSGPDAVALLYTDGRRLLEEARSTYRRGQVKESKPRAKRIRAKHFKEIRESLGQISRAQAVDWLDDWMVAGVNTGLRPGEWALAHIETRRVPDGGRRIWLHVVNAKATHGRGNGEYRTLDISDFRDSTLEAIGRQVQRAHKWTLEGKFAQRQADVADLFYHACSILCPKENYSLYSLRHQFIANMKSATGDAAVVATLCGHISIETQIEHYGKKRSSWLGGVKEPFDVPHALADQVAPVQAHMAELEKRQVLKAKQELADLKKKAEKASEDSPSPAR
ncbi:hypothetical protein C7G42_07835 [Bradyrhizobium sp. MOS003]|nr:hypothetical protein C7G42_07835 [Bradyrhizobium sp. MOS003]